MGGVCEVQVNHKIKDLEILDFLELADDDNDDDDE